MHTRNISPEGPRVAVVGAGMSGLLAGIRLKARGYSQFAIYEKAGSLARERRGP